MRIKEEIITPDLIKRWLDCCEEAGKVIWDESNLYWEAIRNVKIFYYRNKRGIKQEEEVLDFAAESVAILYIRFKEGGNKEYSFNSNKEFIGYIFKKRPPAYRNPLENICDDLIKKKETEISIDINRVLNEQIPWEEKLPEEKQVYIEIVKKELAKSKEGLGDFDSSVIKEKVEAVLKEFKESLSPKLKKHLEEVEEFLDSSLDVGEFLEIKGKHSFEELRKKFAERGLPKSTYDVLNLRLRNEWRKFKLGNSEGMKKLKEIIEKLKL